MSTCTCWRCNGIATRLYNADKCVINQRGRRRIQTKLRTRSSRASEVGTAGYDYHQLASEDAGAPKAWIEFQQVSDNRACFLHATGKGKRYGLTELEPAEAGIYLDRLA
jgi:hypothetical protein